MRDLGSRPALLRHTALTAVLFTAFALAGCVSDGTISTHAPSSAPSYKAGSDDAMKAVGYWSKRYESKPKDRAAALGYGSALRRNDQLDQAMAVLRRGLIAHPGDREIASAYGKVLALNGRFKEALNVMQEAQDPTDPDWKLISAEAAINDQLGDHAHARELYSQALKIAPGEPSVLNNLAMSYVLENSLDKAETLLRQASRSPRADSRVRQNLALVLGLQGRYGEAEQVARSELDPVQVNANMAYLKKMMASKGTWQNIKKKKS